MEKLTSEKEDGEILTAIYGLRMTTVQEYSWAGRIGA
jgi:hypothetical protein